MCHDLFDTCERYKIFFRALTERYPGKRERVVVVVVVVVVVEEEALVEVVVVNW